MKTIKVFIIILLWLLIIGALTGIVINLPERLSNETLFLVSYWIVGVYCSYSLCEMSERFSKWFNNKLK